ncbi:MAG TPA: hypothetical protein VMW80_10020 [Candidatus Dormibacteraeota bacterium]|nr:hypothetical protein [Candidatus Dormibacteraeota bacterium]
MSSKLSIDLRPLRQSSDLRRLFGRRAVSQVGTTITTVAASLQVYHLSHSSLEVGALVIGRFSPSLRGARLRAGTVTVLADAATSFSPDPRGGPPS